VHPPGPSDLLTDRAARAPTVGRGTRPVNHPQCSRRGNLRCPMGQDGAENTRRLRSTHPSDGACTQQKKCPRRRADLQDDQPQKLLRLGQGTRCGIPAISRRATTRQPGSRARSRTCRFRRGAAPGPACGRAAPDRRDATPPQRTRSKSWGRRRAVGRREAVRNLEKYREPSSRSTPLHHTIDAGGDA
jgi:hypothetical protein